MSRAAASPPLVPPAKQEHDATLFGMGIFLASEFLLFGGLFTILVFYRIVHGHEVVEASKELHLWIGALNTVVLLTSSLAAALAAKSAKDGDQRLTQRLLLAAAALGAVFLVIKAGEYSLEYGDGMLPVPGGGGQLVEPLSRLFMNIYLVATGLHAVHLTIGIGLFVFTAFRIWHRSIRLPQDQLSIVVPTLYWHLVDIVWIFLYPALYLQR
ncbi:cytochrome c oxidase subunit 3 [Tianweitania sediminis]|uniref:Cytochrome c oxidase subunit 3 n=1 Tax=Tianweitania sediminis TaxID=1502156 RepID=A0A8J7R0C1_9HYPH|nr:cytochrome c oxidase subunit 3 [Tianweitania sediminis]MBP0439520.1 cytochrome c oxidase subunit 3 [Tianweitania sediminis]